MILALNGIPLATLELKNPMSATRWNVEDAKHQYRFERDPKDPLYAFKLRCLVHFAVDKRCTKIVQGHMALAAVIANAIRPAPYPVENLSISPHAGTFSLVALSMVIGQNASGLNVRLR
jgi:hypothetical protein